ncbi:MAG: serine/threonine-protein kinase [Vicinamibacterales bacterium]
MPANDTTRLARDSSATERPRRTARTPANHGPTLPPELLASSRARLGRFALLLAGLFLAVAVAVQSVPWDVLGEVPGWDRPPTALRVRVAVVQLGLVALHLAMYWITRSRRITDRLALRAGLVYEVALCLIITTGDQWLSFVRDGRYQDLTFAALIIPIYPLFVPGGPRATVVGAAAAAAMLPGGLWLLNFAGQSPPFEAYFVATITGAVCVAVAVVGSAVIHGLHRAVAEARELGAYRLESPLGRGGMGEVWRAKHRLLARPAAVKVMRPEVLGARGADDAGRLLRRFEREAQATAQLTSPHTIALYDFGVGHDGTFYYVMELLDGLDLATLVERHGPIGAARTAHLLAQVCDSLGEAHASGLIHRDIKPANIYVCRYGRRSDFVKVLDFGLVTSSDPDGDTSLTRDHVVGGTPAFMAPEQAIGDRPVDGRTDLYAVGCVAYWLLTGRPVFEGTTPMETLLHHARTAPVPPSRRAEVEVPPAMDAIVLACLEKDPARRPQSADDLAARLADARLAAGWADDHATRWWARHHPASA